MKRVLDFLENAKVYYLATMDGLSPRVRPFGTIMMYNDKLYIQTGKVKDCAKQLKINPKFEICAFLNGDWIRISGNLILDDSRDARVAMLEKYPELKSMYSPDDGNTEVYYMDNCIAKICSFTKDEEIIKF